MSRDFKMEYTSYLDQQAPDLWDRIDAGLCPKSMAPVPAKRKTRRPAVWVGSLTAAAAVLLCVVAMPLFVGRSKSLDSAENASQYMMVADGAFLGDAGQEAGEVSYDFSTAQIKEEAEAADQEEVAGIGQTSSGSQRADGADIVQTTENTAQEQKAQKDTLDQEDLKDGVPAEMEKLMAELVVSEAKIELLAELEQQEGMLRYLAAYDGREVILACTRKLADEYSLEAGKSYTADLGSTGKQANSQNGGRDDGQGQADGSQGRADGSQGRADFDYLILAVK